MNAQEFAKKYRGMPIAEMLDAYVAHCALSEVPASTNLASASPEGVRKPLTYEQEIHSLMYAGKRVAEDLLSYLNAQAKQESGEAKKLTIKAADWVKQDWIRFKTMIPQALARRDAAKTQEWIAVPTIADRIRASDGSDVWGGPEETEKGTQHD